MLKKNYLIKSKKFDGKIHKSWSAKLLRIQGTMFVFKGVFDRQIKHSHLGVIRPGTISYEYYWLDKWFNVFKFFEPDGIFRNFYCNVNLPPKINREILEYVDLEIDVIIRDDFSHEILDLDEFAANSRLYNYSEEMINCAEKALEEILQISRKRIYPFDSITLDKFI